MALATVTSKGQVTIPKSVRKALQIKAGDRLEFTVQSGGVVIIRPISKRVDDVFGRLRERAASAVSIEEMNLAVRKRIEDQIHEGS